jgi:hypothetical protein
MIPPIAAFAKMRSEANAEMSDLLAASMELLNTPMRKDVCPLGTPPTRTHAVAAIDSLARVRSVLSRLALLALGQPGWCSPQPLAHRP